MQENPKERKSTEIWVAFVFVPLESNHTGVEATERLGELPGACVGNFAGLEAGQNAGFLVGKLEGVLVGENLGLSSLSLTRMLCTTCGLE